MTLSAGELTALKNLADKKAGRDVDWIAISHARALTELGYAQRNQAGWQITTEGEAALLAAGLPPPSAAGPDGG